MTLLLIIDTETDGLGDKDTIPNCLEVAALLYNVDNLQIVSGINFLTENCLNIEFNPVNIKPIPKEYTSSIINLLRQFESLLSVADYVIGHNVKFDIEVLTKYCQEVAPNIESKLKEIKHLCTYHDFNFFPYLYEGKRTLTDMALIKNVPVWKPHRAYRDCLLIADIFDSIGDGSHLLTDVQIAASDDWIIYANKNDTELPKQCYRWSYSYNAWYIKEALMFEKEGKAVKWNPDGLVKVCAIVSYDERELAKEYGFKWNPLVKQWENTVLSTAFNQFPFKLKQI